MQEASSSIQEIGILTDIIVCMESVWYLHVSEVELRLVEVLRDFLHALTAQSLNQGFSAATGASGAAIWVLWLAVAARMNAVCLH